MAWPEDFDEQMRRQWRSRLAQERLDLSASVEATLKSLHEGQLPDTLETTHGSVQTPQRKAIIPPRLSLQSRSMPALNQNPHALSLGVRRSFTSADTSHAHLPAAPVEPATEEQSANLLVRLAHRITSSLSSFFVNSQDEQRTTVVSQDSGPLALLDEPRNGPRVYESSLAIPWVHASLGPLETITPPLIRALPAPCSTEMQSLSQGKQLIPKRPTKVHLESASTQGTVAREGLAVQMEGQDGFAMGTMLSGSGVFETGRSEAAVVSSGVRSSSVVMVMLGGDPGPVVVHYITLRPRVGFTVHLSAPALVKTPFNYVVLAGEQR